MTRIGRPLSAMNRFKVGDRFGDVTIVGDVVYRAHDVSVKLCRHQKRKDDRMKKSTSAPSETGAEEVRLPSALTAQTAREGIRRFLPMAAMLASLTKTDVDDKGVQLLSAIVNSDEVFAAIVNLLPKGEGDTAPVPSPID